MKISWITLTLLFALFNMQCQEKTATTDSLNASEQAAISEKEGAQKDTKIGEPISANTPNTVMGWVENLNVRADSKTTAAVMTTVQPSDALVLTGKKSDFQETIVLRGAAYYDHWVEVTTPDGSEGWVFGGVGKKPDEEKGNRVMTDLNFEFPDFGAFDLSSWTFAGSKNTAGGDAESVIKTYKHTTDERTMIITHTDVGDYGYLIEHKLLGMNDRPLKSRLFHFDNDQRILTEEVTTHNIDPIHKTTRQQKIRVSHFQLNPRPILVLDE